MCVTSLQNCLPNIIENGCCTITEQSDDEEHVMQEWNATTFLSNLEKAPYVCFAGVKITDETGSVFTPDIHLQKWTCQKVQRDISAEALMISLYI